MLEMRKLRNEWVHMAYTENGALTYRTTGSACLDLFGTIGAMRNAKEEEICVRFLEAYLEAPDLAMKILFFARDVRGGMGERRVFRVILRFLADLEPRAVEKNLALIPEYGRYDDLLCLMGTPCEKAVLQYIRRQLAADKKALAQGGQVSLLAKWLPSANASSRRTVALARQVARGLGMSQARYRRTLSTLRAAADILENRLREKDYTFAYEKQPSRALFQYQKAFERRDGKRYKAFIDGVLVGGARLNTKGLDPYEIIRPILQKTRLLSWQQRQTIQANWQSQEDFTAGENALVVVDSSGSMYESADALPAAVALSLGIYYAERNRGPFHNRFILFSQNPYLVELKGRDIWGKVKYCRRFSEVAQTDIQQVFRLILGQAIKNQAAPEEMPARLYIISDMEFDRCVTGWDETNFQYARRLFESYGYRLPQIIFWNVNSRSRQQPVQKVEHGVALVSGCSPRIFSLIKQGELDPVSCMYKTLDSERYRPVTA